MTEVSHRVTANETARRPSRPLAITAALIAACGLAGNAAAQEPTMSELLKRIDEQDKRINELNGRLGAQDSPGANAGTGFEVKYDKGYVLRSTDPSDPFMLRINGRMQFRYAGFAPDSNSPTPTPARSDFEIERGRLEFSGTWLNPGTHFYINLDADTDDNHNVIFHDFWVNHDFSDALSLYVGKAFFPGTREWISGSTTTHLIDRSLATTFFRPDRTLGVWAIGEPIEDFHYRFMVGNGLETTDLKPSEINDRFAYALSLWWDPLADYGKGFADLEHHEDLAMRVGTTLSYSAEQGSVDESEAVRLSDGRDLSAVGVDSFNFHMATVDAAMKFLGFSMNGEVFYRWLSEVKSATFMARSQEDWGAYCDAGFMIVPKSVELVARVSTVQGELKDTWEYAGGCNYYIDGTHQNKLSMDVTKLNGSPTNSSGPDFRIGDDGLLVRIQWQIAF